MEIYRFETRLFMIMETEENFSFERKAAVATENPKVQEWENLMLNTSSRLKTQRVKWV